MNYPLHCSTNRIHHQQVIIRLACESNDILHSVSGIDFIFCRLDSQVNLLAGVDNIMNRCKDVCLRSFMNHASMNVVLGGECNRPIIDIKTRKHFRLVSALLVTGRRGAGKTSIVQAIAKSLQDDSRVHSCTL